jgi:fermentation-respiration switch protein FrsA (DUF1100 family)
MKKLYILLVLGFLCPFVNAQSVNDISGSWQGSIAVNGIELGLIFKIKSASGIEVKMDVPMQGAKDIPADTATFLNDTVKISFKSMGASYEGVLHKNEKLIEGKWKQGGQSFSLKLTPATTSTGFKRPQEPVAPFPYHEEEVTFTNKQDNITLSGTLTLPSVKGSFPAVVLISGSGAQNRDEEVLGHKPFLVLADHLTRKGIAVLRFDDRGVGKSGGDHKSATSADFSKDVLAAVNYLLSRKEIDKNKIGLIGHSEGGMIAPMVAAEEKKIAFIVLLAGPGLKGSDLLLLQSKALLKANGEDDSSIEKINAINKQAYMLAGVEPRDSAYAQVLRLIKDAEPDENNAKAQVNLLLSPWMKYFLQYDPVIALGKVKCPVLAINGDKDLQVCAQENLQGIQAALKAGGNTNCTVKTFTGLNHLFQQCTTGLPGEYAKIEETISPLVLNEVGEWIKELVK